MSRSKYLLIILGLMISFVSIAVLVDKARTSGETISNLESDLLREKHNHKMKEEELRKVMNHQETLNVRINELEIELGQVQEDLSVERENHKATMADSQSKDDVISHLTSENERLKKTRALIAKQSEAKPKAVAQPEQQIQTASEPKEPPKESDGRKIGMRVTAYGADCNGCEGKTASGTNYTKGRTLACPKQYAFGTKIDIPALGGTFICEDRGGAIKGNTFDMFYGANEADTSSFGVKYVEGYIRE
ncbi:3D domain-containing protein [Bacillus thuringiensis]|uniref:3D domain-containing protein n=1 Tax=Bacillus thuringiensis TaxID=1428 RepID=UPI0020766259|nr:3D domain-containing protein [Bacillus thuringiensis]MED3275359.1 3D domain-containing protein [Bacillus thuringiensis]